MKVLIIDNFDSFTYNLYQYVGEILSTTGLPRSFSVARNDKDKDVVDVVRNNEITVAEIRKRNYNRIIISPGPGRPETNAYFGVCGEVLTTLGKEVPVLGVCLGMQGIAHYFGGKVVRAKKPMHGKISLIKHDGKGVFAGLPQGLEIMRYHSLVVERKTLSACLEISAVVNSRPHPDPLPPRGLASSKRRLQGEGNENGDQDMSKGEIMGLRHKKYPIEGIQFHPESFGTEGGKKMIENFLEQKALKIKDPSFAHATAGRQKSKIQFKSKRR